MEFTEYKEMELSQTLNSICVILYNHGNQDKHFFYAAICVVLANEIDPEDETIRNNRDICYEQLSPSEIEAIQLINVNIGLVVELLREIVGYNRIERLLNQPEDT